MDPYFGLRYLQKKDIKIKEIKKILKNFGGYLTIIKTSADYDYEEKVNFYIDDVRLNNF